MDGLNKRLLGEVSEKVEAGGGFVCVLVYSWWWDGVKGGSKNFRLCFRFLYKRRCMGRGGCGYVVRTKFAVFLTILRIRIRIVHV